MSLISLMFALAAVAGACRAGSDWLEDQESYAKKEDAS